jgi:hypothetical protein
MGTVNDLILNTRTKLVEIVELTDGREYHAQKVEIGDGVIYIDTTALEDGVVYIHTLLRDHEENLKRLETA